jgi:Fic family protein
MYAEGDLPETAPIEFLRWLHSEFYRNAPESMLWIENEDHGFRMEPGVFRFRSEHDVSVGRHIPLRSERVDKLMRHFEQRYRLAGMGKGAQIIAMVASHHRLANIIPFPKAI